MACFSVSAVSVEVAALLGSDGGDAYCVNYLDRMEEEDGDTSHLCLLMSRVLPRTHPKPDAIPACN